MLALWILGATLAPSPADAQGFTERASEAGLVAPQQTNPTRYDCGLSLFACIGHLTGGVAVGDVDGDPYPDIVFARPYDPMVVYRNRGDGTFEDISELAGLGAVRGASGLAFADLDGDGREDLLISVIDGPSHLVFRSRWPSAYELDAETSAVLRHDSPLQNTGFGFALGDYDRDGHLDVLSTHWGGGAGCGDGRTRFYRGTGRSDVLLEDLTERVLPWALDPVTRDTMWWAFGGSFSDIDGDGWQDLLVTGDFDTTRFFWNDAGSYRPIDERLGIDRFGMGSTIADFDGDGGLDVFISGISPEILGGSGHALHLYRGARTFEDATSAANVRDGGWGWGVAAFDADHDGDQDLVMATGDPLNGPEIDPIRFWRNRGDAVFDEVGQSLGFTDSTYQKGLALLDYDRDGDQDVVIARNRLPPLLYRNDDGVARGQWLRVRVSTSVSAPGGFGTRVTVTVGDRSWVSEIGTTSHYVGQSERVAQFGFGPRPGGEPRMARVEVRFLSGHVVTLADVSLDQELEIAEPNTPPPLPSASIPAFIDCDGDDTADTCEVDCDENGVPDDCEVWGETTDDCNGNQTPDACELNAGFETDCDQSGTLDSCEVRDDPTLDCNGNAVHDACEVDPCVADAGPNVDLGTLPVDAGPASTMDAGVDSSVARDSGSNPLVSVRGGGGCAVAGVGPHGSGHGAPGALDLRLGLVLALSLIRLGRRRRRTLASSERLDSLRRG